jgi:hypothetical protein
LSPQKRKLFQKIEDALSEHTEVFFWADIDLGGFQMFQHLRLIIPRVAPMRMSGKDVAAHSPTGLKRSDDYLRRLKIALDENEFPLFNGAIEQILKYGVTIEQEAFLTQ